jgi:NADH:ubiquinone oxidoreductase subunit F (NADH-binding)/NAD-dependent dihydropyrimidine dehydrogenase PreA subunit/(2Fe-2S) ferredoxin
MKLRTLEDLEQIHHKTDALVYPEQIKITVGTATCGLAAGGSDVLKAVIDKVKELNLNAIVKQTGCIGYCQEEPIIDIWQPGKPRVFYSKMTPKKVGELLAGLKNDQAKKEWALGRLERESVLVGNHIHRYALDKTTKELEEIPLLTEIPFYQKQMKIVLRNCGFIDPESIEEYIARGGYYSLYKILSEKVSPESIIDTIKQSGLRGRGGGGFPTGIKWESCRKAESEIRYVICNADEGDPGAYMDRSVLEGDPHSVIEGMLIGAYAIGSHQGYIYVRNEYPQAVKKLQKAIKQAEEYGLLGDDIFGSGFSFNIKINRGGGAFVCGESTALMASLEGKVGEPRAKYIHTVEHGLYNRPSALNNVETWANVPVIIDKGADWFASIGTEKSKGTKVFSLVGKVKNSGLIEVPMGISLREIMFDIGGGTPTGKKFKAVQTGGPSGGCILVDTAEETEEVTNRFAGTGPHKMELITKTLIDIPVDFDTLTQAGSMMGSGGMIVMDEDACMIDVAKFFMNFLKDESCGKCTPCREGIRNMLHILTEISEGRGKEGDIELLEELSASIIDTSLCALGGSAPNQYFRDEYIAHIKDKKCPAGVCRALIKFSILANKCTGCTACVRVCPVNCITGQAKQPHVLNQSACIKCGACYEVCRFDAVLRA